LATKRATSHHRIRGCVDTLLATKRATSHHRIRGCVDTLLATKKAPSHHRIRGCVDTVVVTKRFSGWSYVASLRDTASSGPRWIVRLISLVTGRTNRLRDLDLGWENSIKHNVKQTEWGALVVFIWLRIGKVARFREHGNKISGYLKCGEFLVSLYNC
jgi:hypothetical protein